MIDALIETWQIHNRINLYLLNAIDGARLPDVAPAKGRSVGAQFAHLHNVRLMWLASSNKEALAGLAKLEGEEVHDKALLAEALTASGEAMEKELRRAMEQGNRVKGFKPHAAAFLGYLIAHEAHHRGQIVLTLKHTGAPVEKKVLFGLWEWGVR